MISPGLGMGPGSARTVCLCEREAVVPKTFMGPPGLAERTFPDSVSSWRSFVVSLLLVMLACGTPALANDEGDFWPAAGLADSAALRATIVGPPPDRLAPLDSKVPLRELEIDIDGVDSVPDVYWFNRRLRVYFSPQPDAAPLAVVIAGTGGGANTAKLTLLRQALYGDGYHVLTLPSPTFPGFIAAASSTGVVGDLQQDGQDLHRAVSQIVRALEARHAFTEVVTLGYSLGGANAAMLKAIDDESGDLGIRRAVMINPPVSLFSSIRRLDRLLALSIGDDPNAFNRFYHDIYTEMARYYAVSDSISVDQGFLLEAASHLLESDRNLAAGIALSFRMSLVDVFFAGDLYSGSGVAVDPDNPPRRGDSLGEIFGQLRTQTFSTYFDRVFAPFYLERRPGATHESLIADNHLELIGERLRNNPDYYAQTNADELILDKTELDWLREVFGTRLVVYDNGGHLGSVGEQTQITDMLMMASGRFREDAR